MYSFPILPLFSCGEETFTLKSWTKVFGIRLRRLYKILLTRLCIHFLFLLTLYNSSNFFNCIIANNQPFCIPRNIRPRELCCPRGKRQRSSDCRISRSCQLRYKYQLQTTGHFRTVQLNPSGSSAEDHRVAMAYLTCETSFAR